MQHGRAETREVGDIAAAPLPYRFGEFDAASFDYDVYIAARPPKQAITDITTDGKGLHAPFSGYFTYQPEHRPVQELWHQRRHSISS